MYTDTGILEMSTKIYMAGFWMGTVIASLIILVNISQHGQNIEKKKIINKIKLFKNVGRVRSIFPLSKLNCFPFSFQMAVECIIDLLTFIKSPMTFRDLWQVGDLLRLLRFPPPIKLTATIYNWNIVESAFKHHNQTGDILLRR
jgi:hypothetical protein